MVIDCRRANEHFAPPAGVSLATGDTLSKLEMPRAACLYVGQVDIREAFYRMRLPRPIRRFFGLRRIWAAHVGVSTVEGRAVGGEVFLRPRLRALPVGWTWGLFWSQAILERCVAAAGLTDETRIFDGRPPVPPGREPHLHDVDNFAVLGTDRERVASKLAAVRDVLLSRGLALHKEEVGEGNAEPLGWHLGGADGSLRPSPRRLWRLVWAYVPYFVEAVPPASAWRVSWDTQYSLGCSAAKAWRSSPLATDLRRSSRKVPPRHCGVA